MMKLASAALLFCFVVAGVAPASAHVLLERKEAVPGSSYKAILTVSHSCEDSPTIKLRVKIPEGFIAAKPMAKPGWTIETVKGPYARSYSYMHGMTIKDGAREIVWSGKLPGDLYDEFVFVGFVADPLVPGETLYFPTEQICEKGSFNWAEIPAPGQSAHALKEPAPSLRLVSGGKAVFRVGAMVVREPVLRAPPPGARVAGGYMMVTNTGKEPDRLTGGTLEGAGRFEIHEMSMTDNVMRMRPLKDGLVIPPGETVTLQPGGIHVMGLDLGRSYTAGQTVKGTLVFEKAGKVDIEYAVRPIGAEGGGHDHKH
jgi:uncharacterized protein YcnI